MKQFSNVWCLFLSVCSFYVHANADLGVTDCSLKGNASCDVFLKMKRNVDDVSYKVELADAENGERITPYFDMNEITENISLQKHGERYVFSKEYLDSTKAIEFITFKYDSKVLSSVRYYYIESSIDFNNNVKKWSGKECDISSGKIPEKKDELLLQAASELCVNQTKLAYSLNKHSGNDILFYLSQITDGVEKKQISVIALDRKDIDAINLSDIGCLSGCDMDSDLVNYIGRLNEKIRIGLHLEYYNNNASGFYFYEKMKKKINVTGRRNGKRLTLSASVPEGIETFDGLLENGQFKGVWSNAAGNKKYPFTFYMKLIQ
ncbi:hypothetical protein L8P27_21140 [Enterobacter asburiae]|uniref:hypothetical protein n=1 Tax=Enterobacter asburiae TaxID=61645 RepID=UPI002005E420|nr:hypothetical protein [Enterobacter asburiae]MCK7230301.1 hypothetical protein [Enterobacter asburiae]